MKKLLLFIIGLLFALHGVARNFEYEYKGQTLIYTVISEEKKTCQLKEGSSLYNYPGNYVLSGKLIIPEIVSDGNSEYTVTTISAYAFYGQGMTEITIPNSVKSIEFEAFYNCRNLTEVTIGNSVTSIAAQAFYGCRSLTEITIPDAVTSIGDYAFYNCSTLAEVKIGSSVTSIGEHAFSYCKGLTEITIPDSTTSIGEYAFENCSNLTEVTVGSSVMTIGNSAFFECNNLEKANFSSIESVCNIEFGVFANPIYYAKNLYINGDVIKTLVIPNSVTSIGNFAFECCTGLTEVLIPNSVTSIGYCAFSNCSGLTKVSIPNSVTSIDSYTFSGCAGLTEVLIPNSVTSIGSYAFRGCSGLTELTIPSSVCTISDDAFYKCTSIEELTIEDGSERLSLGNNTQGTSSRNASLFDDCPLKSLYLGRELSYNAFSGSSIEKLIIGNTEISSRAFHSCTNLTTVEIGNYVTCIEDEAFYDCPNLDTVYFNAENCETSGNSAFPPTLKKIIFGKNVKSIPPCMFYGCSLLNSIEIPNSVSTIGTSAFGACSGLNTLYFNAENCETCGSEGRPAFPRTLKNLVIGNDVKSLPDNAFYHCSELTAIEIPESVASIGKNTFYGCVNFASVSTSTLEDWLKIEFGNEYSNPTYYAKKLLVGGETIRRLTIPEGTTRINAFAFVNCEPLVTVTFPTSIKSVGDAPFIGCTGLQRDIFPSVESYLGLEYDCSSARITNGNNSKIYIDNEEYDPEEINWPESLTRIPGYAFFDNRTLKHINIPETVTEIGVGAFYWCSGLSEIEIPSEVTKIEDNTFNQCSSLKSVKLPDSLKSIGNYSFCACALGEIEIPSSVTSIDEDAFYNSHINSVRIGDIEKWSKIEFGNEHSNPITYAKTFSVDGNTVKHLDLDLGESGVGQYAFCNAKNLETIRVKASSIGESAFNGCSNAKQVCIDVDELLEYSFAGNSNLEALYCKRENPSAASDNTFSKYEGVILYVPEGAVSRYENAETCWWRFLDVKESNFSNLDEIFSPDFSSIDNIFINDESPMEVYSINGVKVGNSTSNLPAGIYIVRQGNKVKKIAVK